MQPLEPREGYVLLRVRVQPRASRNSLKCDADGRVRVHLTAPPVEGAANQALCNFVASALEIAKSSVSVVAGEKSREKTLRIEGVDPARVERVLERAP